MHYFIEVLAHMTKPLRGINRMLNNTCFPSPRKTGWQPIVHIVSESKVGKL